ncbi:uncharacterized protein LOC131329061 isoform X3 [Rhododendron vialii]|uniref:uncharacterized protein LOC131329061 isoform X3 n=1 Tax=Rhododendron vialii TaxID=182163 RepID=UPI00265D9552|nr:uncharacterized protein LOC131329061 isoform X3 [Rhododendron vialii]
MAMSLAIGLRILFCVLGCVMLATLTYTLSVDGFPFRKDLLTPWMLATLIDFYINVVALGAWVCYKESNWISASLWIVLLVCFGSITTCFYIVLQFLKLSIHDALEDPIHYVLFRYPTKWMTATLIDFYINVVALSVWVAYKESSWLNAVIWIVLLICFGSITTCTYIVRQLFHLLSQDPVYLVLLKSSNRQV